MADIAVIGAGVAGLCVALELTRRGHRPRLYDRVGPPGAHGCSWWAGGMLAPFCEAESAEPPVVVHGRAAADWWAEVTPVARAGSLVLALDRDRGELDRFARRTQGHGWIDADRLAALEPDLAQAGRRALFFAEEAHLDPRRALADLVAALAERGVAVERREVEPDALAAAGTVVDCRGLAARDALPALRGVRGEMAVLRCPEISLSRPVRLLHPRHPLYIVPRGDGVFMLGATQIESAARGPATARSVLELLSAAYALHPAFGEAELLEIGADARPAFPDNLPRIVKRGPVLHVNGLFRHGYLLAPSLARQLAEHLDTGAQGEFFHED